MDACSETCEMRGPAGLAGGQPELSQDVENAAVTLACLLTDTIEFQNFARLSRAVRLDQEVNRILNLMEGYEEEALQPGAERTLEERLESLPVMRAYREAERAVREVFCAVDGAISAEIGFAFAENAKPSGCG